MSRARPRLLVAVAATAICIAVTALLAEGLARASGARPWSPYPYRLAVEPGGRFYQSHPALGYRHLAGRFTVTLEDGYSFHVTHGADTLRITHEGSRRADRPGIWLFGCSFTHGWSLDDEDTWPWLLQAALPEAEVVNFGVGGYGTVHSLIQLREALADAALPPPRAIVLAYAGFHDARNTFLRARRKEVAPWNRLGPLDQAQASLAPDGSLRIGVAATSYAPFPLMTRSAAVHLVETGWNRLEAWRAREHEVSEALVAEMARLAQERGIRFILAYIHEHPPMSLPTDPPGIETLDIAVDLSLPGNSNEPHDNHPGPAAARQYAARLLPVLRAGAAGSRS